MSMFKMLDRARQFVLTGHLEMWQEVFKLVEIVAIDQMYTVQPKSYCKYANSI